MFPAPYLVAILSYSNLFNSENQLQLIILTIVFTTFLQQCYEIENLAAFTMHLCEQYLFPTERKMHSRLKHVYST